MNGFSRRKLHGTVCAEARGSSAEAIGPRKVPRKLHVKICHAADIPKAVQGGLQAPGPCHMRIIISMSSTLIVIMFLPFPYSCSRVFANLTVAKR